MYKYSVLTFIFGDYECLHEVLDIHPNVEYICVTDNRRIKSNTWKIMYDDINSDYTSFRKVLEVRYNPFKYVSTNTCLIIDGSIQLTKFPINLLSYFEINKYDIAAVVHPERSSVIEEIDAWKNLRNLSKLTVNVCKNIVTNLNYNSEYKGLFQTGLLLVKNNDIIKNFFSKVLQINNVCSYKNDTFRVDQIIFSIILNKQYSENIKLIPLSAYELHGKYFGYYKHNTNKRFFSVDLSIAKIDYKYVFNKLKECYFIDNLQNRSDELTVAICNFNTTKMTNNVIKDIIKFSNANKIIVFDNSNVEKFKLDESITENVKILDNTTQKYINFDNLLKSYTLTRICKSNNYASLKHCMSIQFLLDICTSKYMLLCDSDITIKKDIDFIEDNLLTISDVEYTNVASQNMNTNYGNSRFTPFMQLFNIQLMNTYQLRYFDPNRIHGIENGFKYDTGASLYEDVINMKIPYKLIKNTDYIIHFGHGSWKNK